MGGVAEGDGEALGYAVLEAVTPGSAVELVTWAGGAPALARREAGLPARGGPLPARAPARAPRPLTRDQERRRAYEAARRRYSRWITTGAERRRPSSRDLSDALRIHGAFTVRRRLAQLRRVGAHCVIVALVVVSKDRQERRLPARGGQYLPPSDVRPWAVPLAAGEISDAGEAFAEAFLTRYGGEMLDLEESSSGFNVAIWAPGEPIPEGV